MKLHLRRLLVLTLVFLLTVGSFTASFACTSVFAGKDATTNGATLIARNEDYASAWPKHFKVFEGESFEPGSRQTFYNGLSVPYPTETFKYMALPDWDPSYGPFEEAGINEMGVAVSATNTHRIREDVLAVDPLLDEGIGETHIPSLILPRAESARQATELFGMLVSYYGAMEGYGFAIADEEEVWYIEVGSGHHWAAVRIPDDEYLIVANQFRLSSVDFDDTQNVMTSTGLEDFVYSNGFLADGETFDFAKAFGQLGSTSNSRREWWGQRTFTPSLEQSAELERYPTFLTPDEKINPKEVMNLLRSDYIDTEYCTDTESGKGERPIGIDRTVESHVIQIRGDMPVEIGGLMWLSMANPEHGVYLPFYAGITETLDAYHMGTDQFDDESAYWAFRGTAALAATDEVMYGAGVKAFWNDYEHALLGRVEAIDEAALALYAQSPEDAISFLTAISNMTAKEAIERAKTMREEIITHMAAHEEDPYQPE